jgi:hypothetical protein
MCKDKKNDKRIVTPEVAAEALKQLIFELPSYVNIALRKILGKIPLDFGAYVAFSRGSDPMLGSDSPDRKVTPFFVRDSQVRKIWGDEIDLFSITNTWEKEVARIKLAIDQYKAIIAFVKATVTSEMKKNRVTISLVKDHFSITFTSMGPCFTGSTPRRMQSEVIEALWTEHWFADIESLKAALTGGLVGIMPRPYDEAMETKYSDGVRRTASFLCELVAALPDDIRRLMIEKSIKIRRNDKDCFITITERDIFISDAKTIEQDPCLKAQIASISDEGLNMTWLDGCWEKGITTLKVVVKFSEIMTALSAKISPEIREVLEGRKINFKLFGCFKITFSGGKTFVTGSPVDDIKAIFEYFENDRISIVEHLGKLEKEWDLAMVEIAPQIRPYPDIRSEILAEMKSLADSSILFADGRIEEFREIIAKLIGELSKERELVLLLESKRIFLTVMPYFIFDFHQGKPTIWTSDTSQYPLCGTVKPSLKIVEMEEIVNMLAANPENTVLGLEKAWTHALGQALADLKRF